MKVKRIVKAQYTGGADSSSLIVSFQVHILAELKKIGLLTEKQYEKGLTLVKERRR